MDRVAAALDHYLNAPTWFQRDVSRAEADAQIAYFSAEFGIHESVPVYSGGLGVLAGDHLKSASDLGLPLVGVSLMYREGYFRQYLNVDGWQQERYPENDFFNLPLIPELDADGTPLLVTRAAARPRRAAAHLAHPGRPHAAVPARHQHPAEPAGRPRHHRPALRRRPRHAHPAGDHPRHRRHPRACGRSGKTPTVCHMNEGHSAFCGLERIRLLMEEHKLDFATAPEAVTAGTVLHHAHAGARRQRRLPAAADRAVPRRLHGAAGHRPRTRSSASAGSTRRTTHEPFGMTVLALKLANVSQRREQAARRACRGRCGTSIWPDLPESRGADHVDHQRRPHAELAVARRSAQLFDRYLGVQWEEQPTDFAVWKRVEHIPDAELWRTHERRRERLVAFARDRLQDPAASAAARRRPRSPRADEVLDPDALTIGFARRFATYKRGDLIFRNLERLAPILNNKDRPVQFIFAGKAHPQDHGGKELIAEIVQHAPAGRSSAAASSSSKTTT